MGSHTAAAAAAAASAAAAAAAASAAAAAAAAASAAAAAAVYKSWSSVCCGPVGVVVSLDADLRGASHLRRLPPPAFLNWL
nr:unnamed protein product [Spirometra erinaceieuropaei]